MQISDSYLVTFSPTHTSKRIGEAIVQGVDEKTVHWVDVTHDTPAEVIIPADALAVFTVPVYGGRVAPLALKRMEAVRSAGGGPAVVVVVYGNRAYEKALEQLDAFVAQRGFQVVAGATFIGEHSYSSQRFPIAQGRPDADDLAYARLFGEKIRSKIAGAPDRDHLYGVDVRKILRPRQPIFPLLRFIYKVVKWRKSGQAMQLAPVTDENLCTHCGHCVHLCPNAAIEKGDEQHTQADKCIRCCACVKGCPQGARTYDTPFAVFLHSCFKREKENRIIL